MSRENSAVARAARRHRGLLLPSIVAVLGLTPAAAEGVANAAYACSTAPSELACKDTLYREKCPGKKDECRPILRTGFKRAYSSFPPRERYDGLDDTGVIVPGHTQKRILDSASLLVNGGFASYEGMEARHKALAQRAEITPSSSYVRAPAWIGTPEVNSCAEYVYEKYYDYMRFIDAANSCKDDAGCVVDMAYFELPFDGQMHTPSPNITSRPMSGRSTQRVPLPPIPLTKGVVPKNAFYNGVILLPPILRDQIRAVYPDWGAMLDNVAGRAYAGSNYYRWGDADHSGPAPVKTFTNEFAYHKAMRELTRNIPVPEATANLHRVHEFEEKLASFISEAYCHGLSGAANCIELPKIKKNALLEMVGGDPWVRNRIFGNETLLGQALTFGLQGKAVRLDGAGTAVLSLESVLDVGMPQLPGGEIGGIGGIDTTSYVIGTQVPPPNEDPVLDPSPVWNTAGHFLANDLVTEWANQPPTLDTSSGKPRLNCAVEAETSAYRLLACEATNALLDEIGRDNPGCLDTNYKGCDWHPSMFDDRFHKTQQYMAERVHDYNQCTRWTLNNFLTVVPADKNDNFEQVEKFIEQRIAAFDAFKAPRRMNGDKVESWGQSESDSITLGDKNTYGGGYSYLVGWSSTPIRKNNAPGICRMEFAADAQFGSWATAFGSDIRIIDAVANVHVNEGDSGDATFTRSLKVFDQEFLVDGPSTVHINHASSAADKEVDKRWGVSKTIILPYGFSITIGGGIEVAAGVAFSASAATPKVDEQTCANGPQPFSAEAVLTPHARASAYLTATGGWMGIVEAGTEAELDILSGSLPVTAKAFVTPPATPQDHPKLRFELSGNLTLTTLSGHVDACGCFVGACECTEVVSWPGENLGTIELFTPISQETDLTLF